MSTFQVSNTRIGPEFKQSDLFNTLEVFLKSQLYGNGEVFPNDINDVKPLPPMSWLNDFSLFSGTDNVGNILRDDSTNGQHSAVWMLNARECWCDFVGIEEANGRPRPFIEPFPLNMLMCYPIPRVNCHPHKFSLDVEYPKNSAVSTLRRSPSDPHCRQTKPYRKTSSTKSTPLSSPFFPRIHKSRSAASVNIPVLSSDRLDNLMPGLSPNISENGSEGSSSSLTEDSAVSGSNHFVTSNTVRNENRKNGVESKNSAVNIEMATIEPQRDSVYRTIPFVSSISGIESDGSGEFYHEEELKESLRPEFSTNEAECGLSILLNVPKALAVKFDHYQFVFLMRLQESFVALKDVLFSDLEKFDIQRQKVQEKVSEGVGNGDTGILLSLVSKGAEVVLFVPAPNIDESRNQDENCSKSHDRGPSPVEASGLVEADLEVMKNDLCSPRDDEQLLYGVETDHTRMPEDTMVSKTMPVSHQRNASETSSVNTSTCGSEYSQSNAGTDGERSYVDRDVSTVTITGTSVECSITVKNDDFAFKLIASGCDITESYHDSLEAYLSQKSKVSMATASKGCGEVKLRYAMGSTVDQTMTGAVENGVARLKLSDVLVALLMSNIDGILECVEDELDVPPPFMPAVIDVRNLRLKIISDTPPRLLSTRPPLPLNLHIDRATITRTGEGEIQLHNVRAPATRQSLYRTHDGLLVTADEMIERLRGESIEMTSRVASIRSENVRLLNELQVASELKESIQNERDKMLSTVERLTEELVKSNREYNKMQELLRDSQLPSKT